MNIVKAVILANLMVSSTAPVMFPQTQVAASYQSEIMQTSPLDDLLKNEEFKIAFNNGYYQKAASSDSENLEGIYPLQMVEWHYGYYDYGIYFYVWNKTQYEGFNLNSHLNGVSIKDVNTGSYNLYPISLVSRTNYQFFKFKVEMPDLTAQTFFSEGAGREYSFGQLHLKKNVSDNGLANSYPYGKKYIFTGSAISDDVEMEQQDIETLNVNVTGGTFRTTSADDGLETSWATYDASMAHNDLHYVYFNIPNSYLSRYGDVAEYHFTYHPILLNPIVTLKGSERSASSIANTADPNDFDENYFARYQWLKHNNTNYVHNRWNDYGFIPYRYQSGTEEFWDIFSFIVSGGLYAMRHFDHIAGDASMLSEFREACISQEFNAIPLGNDAEAAISSEAMDEIITLDNLSDWASLYFNGKTYNTFEELWNASLVEERVRYDQANYELKSYDKYNHSKAENTWRNKHNGYEVGDDVVIHPIDKITSSSTSTDQKNYCLEDDADMVSAFHDNYLLAQSRNETPYIFRFCQTQSIIESLFYCQIGNENDFWFYGTLRDSVRAGSINIAYGIYDLVSLDLTFIKDGNETIIPIAADPININPPQTPGQDPVDPDPLANLWNTIKQFLMYALIFVIIVLILWLIFKIWGWFNKAQSKKR